MPKKTISTKKEVVSKKKSKEQELENALKIVSKNGYKIAESGEVVVDAVAQDLRTAVIVLSVAVNMIVFMTWVIVNITSRYDHLLLSALISR